MLKTTINLYEMFEDMDNKDYADTMESDIGVLESTLSKLESLAVNDSDMKALLEAITIITEVY